MNRFTVNFTVSLSIGKLCGKLCGKQRRPIVWFVWDTQKVRTRTGDRSSDCNRPTQFRLMFLMRKSDDSNEPSSRLKGSLVCKCLKADGKRQRPEPLLSFFWASFGLLLSFSPLTSAPTRSPHYVRATETKLSGLQLAGWY